MSASVYHRPHLTWLRRTQPQEERESSVHLNAVREVAVVGIAIFLYFFVRGLMHSKFDVALANAHHVVGFERRIGIFHEPGIQEWVTKHEWLVTIFNSVYIYGHWPVLIGTLVWLLWRHRDYFPVFRSALLISGAMGLVVFVTFPMAPPRFLPQLGFVDTVTLHTHAYRVLQPPAFTNQYASMPSLHVGWNLLMGVAIVMLARNRFARVFGVLMPLTMYTATILTANHYFVDGIAGSAFAMVGFAIAWRISGPHHASGGSPVVEEPSANRPRETAAPQPQPQPQHVAA